MSAGRVAEAVALLNLQYVVLTAVAAILGVLPIAFGINVEFVTREIAIGAPATKFTSMNKYTLFTGATSNDPVAINPSASRNCLRNGDFQCLEP